METVLVKTLVSLAAVLGLMLGVLFLVRRYVQGGARASSSLVEVELLGQRSLGPRRSVQVLKVLDRVLVVGVSEQGMQSLADLSADGALEELRQERQAKHQERSQSWKAGLPGRVAQGFAAHLRSAIGVRQERLTPTEDLSA